MAEVRPRHRFSFVVGGWRPQDGTKDRLAALLVGEPTADGLLFRGRVGSGIGGAAGRLLESKLAGRSVGASPFADEVPAVDARGTFWVEPFLVIDVDSLNKMPVTRLRQPSYAASAPTSTPPTCWRTVDMSEIQVDVEGRTLTISNLDKVLYPRTGTTKGEVLNYYAQVAPVLLPHLRDRAVTRIRWPHGVEGSSFFEKNAPPGTPSWVRTHEVPTTGSRSGKGDGTIRFPICDDLATLTWLANLASLEDLASALGGTEGAGDLDRIKRLVAG